MKIIKTEKAPLPLGHYEQAIISNELMFISGQLPLDHNGNVPESIAEQTILTIKNIEYILKAEGLSLKNIIKTTIYITDLDIWPEVNQSYATCFGDHKPARAAVPVTGLPKACQIEIEAIASTTVV